MLYLYSEFVMYLFIYEVYTVKQIVIGVKYNFVKVYIDIY